MALVGIVAKTRERAERVRNLLGISPQTSVLISTANSARGCKLDAVVWVGHVEDEIIQAVRPALVGAQMEAQVWER